MCGLLRILEFDEQLFKTIGFVERLRIMPDCVIAPPGASLEDRNRADRVLDRGAVVGGLAGAFARADEEIELTAGRYDVNAGFTSAGNRYLSLAPGVTVRGAGPGLTVLVGERHPCRLTIPEASAGVTLANFGSLGYVGLQDYADRFMAEDLYISQAFGGVYVPFGRQGGCTAAFMVWGRKGRTVRDLVFRRCTSDQSYHHGFSLNLAGAPEGGGFADVLYDQCIALNSGSGFEGDGKRDWSGGFDIPDAGDIEGLTVRDCQAIGAWQDGFHLDGSWNGHRQRAVDVRFERCRAAGCGWRSGTRPAELYQSGFYVQSATLVDCEAEHCRKAGFLAKNNEPGTLVLERCRDLGSAYSFVIEYGGVGAVLRDCVSDGATRRALQATASGASIDLEIRRFAGAGRPVLAGITERLEFVDAPGHLADVNGPKYRQAARPFSGALVLGVEQLAPIEALVEVHPPSVRRVDLSAAVVRVLAGLPDGAPPYPLAAADVGEAGA